MNIERRLLASLRLDAFNGTAEERGVVAAQAGEAVKEITRLRSELAAMTASRDRLAAELRIILNGDVCDQYEKWAKERIRIVLRQGGYREKPNAKG